jgi:hypothetical protein
VLSVQSGAWLLGNWLRRAKSSSPSPNRRLIIEAVIRIITSVVVLGSAFCGFFFLPAYQATLWLIFWIVAYPVALAFATGEALGQSNLVKLYSKGVEQIPILGQLYSSFVKSHEIPSAPLAPRDHEASNKPDPPKPPESDAGG